MEAITVYYVSMQEVLKVGIAYLVSGFGLMELGFFAIFPGFAGDAGVPRVKAVLHHYS
ncbi:MAG TPA: hypothetical protein O0Y06_09895 [Methanocorpusculum sp.]|nr:hypothetical protein [Methanocorpusculum sp.]HJK81194.1 hypothetical protein [Methanocorpusculum sp.]